MSCFYLQERDSSQCFSQVGLPVCPLSCYRVLTILFIKYFLSRCSFHAYADSTYAKHLENGASLYGTVGAPTPLPGGTFSPNGEVPREFQQSVMEMSDDSITSIEHHAAPQDWVVPPTAVMAPARTNGVASPNENGE